MGEEETQSRVSRAEFLVWGGKRKKKKKKERKEEKKTKGRKGKRRKRWENESEV
jgi:hypothetical protein